MLRKYYQLLSKIIDNSGFDAHWKEEVEDSISGSSSLSEEAGDAFLDKEIEKGEIACVQKLKNR